MEYAKRMDQREVHAFLFRRLSALVHVFLF